MRPAAAADGSYQAEYIVVRKKKATFAESASASEDGWLYKVKYVGYPMPSCTREPKPNTSQSLYDLFAMGERVFKGAAAVPSLAPSTKFLTQTRGFC